jgi:nucleoside-diphosphate-sugar epimerase
VIADFADANSKQFRGKLNPKVYDDLENIEEVLTRPDGAPHRHTDKIIQAAGEKHRGVLGTAIVCPPDIYGKGSGPVKVESVYFPAFIKESQKLGGTFYYGEGENRRGWTSVESVVEVFVRLVEEAAKEGGGSATWGREGYYFLTSEEASQKDLATKVGKILHSKGVLSSPEPKEVDEATIQGTLSDWGYDGLGWYMFAGNSRAKAGRVVKELGWEPKGKGLWDRLEGDIDLALGSGFDGKLKLGKE